MKPLLACPSAAPGADGFGVAEEAVVERVAADGGADAAAVARVTGGNPFLVVEMLRAYPGRA